MSADPRSAQRKSATTAISLPSRQAAISRGAVSHKTRINLAGLGFLIYLWVIHSAKLPLGAAAIVVGLVGLVLQKDRLKVPAPLLWLGAFVLWASLGYFSAEIPSATSQKIWEYIKIWLIFLLAVNVAHTRSQLRWMMIGWLGIFALYPVRGILFNFISGYHTQGRYAWNFVFSNPNDFATLTLPMLAMSVAMLQSAQERWVRYCALAGVGVLPITIVITQSRGGILALSTFAALVLIQYRRRVGAILLVLMVIVAISQIAPPEVWGRLSGLKNLTSESTIGAADSLGSAQQRYDIWRVARAITADHPIFGSGIGSYGQIHARYAATRKYPGFVEGRKDAHSTYLHTSAETGLPGLALFLCVITATFYLGLRAAARLKVSNPTTARSIRTLLFGLIAFLQACVFASMEYLPFLYIYIAIICTMITVNQGAMPGTPAHAPVRRRG
jgi:probable O-glycosylation ligase (exosortase A-associated)